MRPSTRVRRFFLRVRAFLARLLRRASGRLLRREAAPGRFEIGSASSLRGYVTTAPLVEPARDYLVYVPRGWNRGKRAPLLVLCHGCRQTPEDIAALTRIAERADREGMLVLLPRQSTQANAWGCWNWFESNTERGAGEAAIVAAQIVEVRRRYRARREPVFVAGLSAGGALAAVLGLRYPRLVRGVLVHSGVACGAAKSAATALTVMRHGPDNDVLRVADAARSATRKRPPDVALIVVHGDRDDVVAPVHAAALVAQFLRFNDGASAQDALPGDASTQAATPGRYPARIDTWRRNGTPLVRRVQVEGLGHAWSGGDGAFAYADPNGPDALNLLARFIADVDDRRGMPAPAR